MRSSAQQVDPEMRAFNPKGPGNWIEYWNQDHFWVNSKIWRLNARLFLQRMVKKMGVTSQDSVLNIGCGSGYMERLLAPKVKSIHAVDTSEHFVEICRRNCRPFSNVRVDQLAEDYTDVSHYGRFSLILCVSVVQYYRNMGEIERLIRSAAKAALPGARMLIADLPQTRNIWGKLWDMNCSFCSSLSEGYAWPFLHAAKDLALKPSIYRDFLQGCDTLSFNQKDVKNLIQRMNLEATIIQESFSVHANRPSLLISNLN